MQPETEVDPVLVVASIAKIPIARVEVDSLGKFGRGLDVRSEIRCCVSDVGNGIVRRVNECSCADHNCSRMLSGTRHQPIEKENVDPPKIASGPQEADLYSNLGFDPSFHVPFP